MKDSPEEILDPVDETLILRVMRRAVRFRFLFGSRSGHPVRRSLRRSLAARGNRSGKEDLRLADIPLIDFVFDLADHRLFAGTRTRSSFSAVLLGIFDSLLCFLIVIFHFRSQFFEGNVLGNTYISCVRYYKRYRIASVNILAQTHKAGIADRILLLMIRYPELVEVVETVIKQFHRVVELIRGFLHQDHADQPHIVSLGTGHQRLSGHFHKSRLAAEYSLVFDLAVDQLVLVEERELFGLSVRGLHEIRGGIRYFGKFFMRKELSRDQRHIISTGVMLLVEQSVGVCKVRIIASQLLGPAVHHIRELVEGTAHFLCQSGRHFIGGGDKESIQTLLHCERLTRINAYAGASVFNTEDRCLRKLHHVVH